MTREERKMIKYYCVAKDKIIDKDIFIYCVDCNEFKLENDIEVQVSNDCETIKLFKQMNTFRYQDYEKRHAMLVAKKQRRDKLERIIKWK